MVKPYQSHKGDVKGMSDSERKAKRLNIPKDLHGKIVLDIGCNEGYFCNLCIERGAKKVIGIDFVKENIIKAKQYYENDKIEFICQSWDVLPPGKFDVILWTSAMHYELDPCKVANNILNALTPDGLFILECGVIYSCDKSFIPCPRVADTRWYPTMNFLLDHILSNFSVRQVEQPEIAEGDFVPRSVFHCNVRLPTILVIGGKTKSGKTSFAHLMSPAASKTISLDLILTKLGVSKFHHNALEELVANYYDPTDLGKVLHQIDDNGFTADFANLVSLSVSSSDRLVVIEGDISNRLYQELKRCLTNKGIVWKAQRDIDDNA